VIVHALMFFFWIALIAVAGFAVPGSPCGRPAITQLAMPDTS